MGRTFGVARATGEKIVQPHREERFDAIVDRVCRTADIGRPNGEAPRHAAASLCDRIRRAAFSAIISVGKFVLALGIDGMTEASTTRRLPTP